MTNLDLTRIVVRNGVDAHRAEFHAQAVAAETLHKVNSFPHQLCTACHANRSQSSRGSYGLLAPEYFATMVGVSAVV